MKLAGSTPPSRQPGYFPSDAFFLLAPCCGFSRGKQKIAVCGPVSEEEGDGEEERDCSL